MERLERIFAPQQTLVRQNPVAFAGHFGLAIYGDPTLQSLVRRTPYVERNQRVIDETRSETVLAEKARHPFEISPGLQLVIKRPDGRERGTSRIKKPCAAAYAF